MSTNTIAFKFNPALIASNLTVVSEGGTLFSITGRVPRQDDDKTHFVLCNTLDEAFEAFTAHAYANSCRERPQPSDGHYDEDEVIFITDSHELGIRLLLPDTTEKQLLVSAPAESELNAGDFTPGLPDLAVSVTAVDGSTAEWLVSPNLTDRWGEINDFDADKKPFHELLSQPELLESLRGQMTGEITFIARKDGVYGLLYEVEYESIESDGQECMTSRLKPYDDVVAAIITSMQQNAHRFPSVEMCVPPADQVCNDRPAAWAFVPDGALHEDARSELADLLNSL